MYSAVYPVANPVYSVNPMGYQPANLAGYQPLQVANPQVNNVNLYLQNVYFNQYQGQIQPLAKGFVMNGNYITQLPTIHNLTQSTKLSLDKGHSVFGYCDICHISKEGDKVHEQITKKVSNYIDNPPSNINDNNVGEIKDGRDTYEIRSTSDFKYGTCFYVYKNKSYGEPEYIVSKRPLGFSIFKGE